MKKKVKIEPGCIGCGLCQALAPKVFDVTDVSHVNENVDFQKYEQEIEEAAASCPVNVIICEDED